MRAFKWFRRKDGQLTSDNPRVGGASVIYHQGVTNPPVIRGTKLFVFKSLDAAYRYRNSARPNIELWDVEIPNHSKPLQYRDRLSEVDYDRIRNFWKGNKSKTNVTRTPRGTYGADWVQPIRRVRF